MSVLSLKECDALENAFLIGLARQALPEPASLGGLADTQKPVLACLALIAQRRRYALPEPVAPARPDPRIPRDDGRPLLDDETARLLLRLVGASAAAPLLEGAVSRLAVSGFRPHPFQTPRIMAALKKQGCAFGLTEKAYLAEIDPIAGGGVALPEGSAGIDENNWTGFPTAIRVDFIAARRRRDSAAARRLVEAAFAAEPANVRVELVGALSAGISSDDRPFLEGLAQDRAQTVRDAAARLLSLIAGAPAHSERLAKAAAGLLLTTEGVIRRKRTLKPASSATTFAQFQALFEGLTIESLAKRLELSAEELAKAVPPASEALLLALASLAARSGNIDALIALIEAGRSGGHGWPAFANVLDGNSPTLDSGQRRRLVAALAPFGVAPFPRARDWRALAALSGETLPASVAGQIFASSGWREFLAALADEKSPRRALADTDLAALAKALPASALNPVIQAANDTGLVVGGAIGAYAGFIAALETRVVPNQTRQDPR
jgi:hypothetical protein